MQRLKKKKKLSTTEGDGIKNHCQTSWRSKRSKPLFTLTFDVNICN